MVDEDVDMPEADAAVSEVPQGREAREPDEAERKLVSKITKRIREDRGRYSNAFKRMRRDMQIARRGAPDSWPEDNYTVNLTGRHINQKVTALYAKNPKAVARRRDRLDFALWDETEQSLQVATQTIEIAMQTGGFDPLTGQPLSQEVQQAMELMQDFQEGMQHRQQVDRIGKTLEILFDYFTKEQSPVDFKTAMKQLVRRASTTGVAYLKLGFQREYDSDPKVSERLSDFRSQMQYVQRLSDEIQDDEEGDKETRERELQHAIESLEAQEYVLMREGLVFDFPESTRVIPDQMCRSLVGFVGARWITVEYLYTPDEVKEVFGVDVGRGFKAYRDDGTQRDADDQPELQLGGYDGEDGEDTKRSELVCVWEHYDRKAGVVYYVADGHKAFLREPGPPDIYVEDFWPVFALTFNEVEDPKNVFPPSDVSLMLDMQMDYNRSRQGQREHRRAARPRFVVPTGMLDDEGKLKLQTAEPFEVIELNMQPDRAVSDIIQPIPMPGVDPNLYETNPLFTDIQLSTGVQEAQFGATSKATATESSIAEGSRVASVDSNVDDLDNFLTRIARASGQVLLNEMSQDMVQRIAGRGAMWPDLSLEEIAEEVYLEVEAGSTGRPNQAQEVRNWQQMLPFLVQMPQINPTFLAKETLKRLDDKMDLTDAIAEQAPAIVAQNRMAAAAPQDPGDAPEQQGAEGGNAVPRGPEESPGTDPPMGNNQV